MDRNEVNVRGFVTSEFEYDHEVWGESFYRMKIETLRLSGEKDEIMVLVSERLMDITKSLVGKCIEVYGKYRSYNKHEEGKEQSQLILYVLAQEIWITDDDKVHFNRINLEGTICKPPTYRVTPLGREIVDIFLAVNSKYGKSSYIPCIAWGRNARYLANFSVGERIEISGRMQSRIYQKAGNKNVAYEVNIVTFKEL